jgi:ribosomal protein S27AE
MRKKKEPWKPYETKCQHCGKTGEKTFPKEKYLHIECKRSRHRFIIKRSIITIKIRGNKETEEYLNKVNSHLIKKERTCLRCGSEFISEGNHNRVCNKCTQLIEKKVVFIVKIYKNPKIK